MTPRPWLRPPDPCCPAYTSPEWEREARENYRIAALRQVAEVFDEQIEALRTSVQNTIDRAVFPLPLPFPPDPAQYGFLAVTYELSPGAWVIQWKATEEEARAVAGQYRYSPTTVIPLPIDPARYGRRDLEPEPQQGPGFSHLVTWIEGPRLVTWLARKLGVRPAFRLPATADVEVALTSVNEAATFRRRGSGPPPPPRPFRETS